MTFEELKLGNYYALYGVKLLCESLHYNHGQMYYILTDGKDHSCFITEYDHKLDWLLPWSPHDEQHYDPANQAWYSFTGEYLKLTRKNYNG